MDRFSQSARRGCRVGLAVSFSGQSLRLTRHFIHDGVIHSQQKLMKFDIKLMHAHIAPSLLTISICVYCYILEFSVSWTAVRLPFPLSAETSIPYPLPQRKLPLLRHVDPMDGCSVVFAMRDAVDCDTSISQIGKGTGFAWLKRIMPGKVPPPRILAEEKASNE